MECARIKVNNPGLKMPINLYDITKNNIEDIPVTISGFTIGILVIFIKVSFQIFFEFINPMQAKVPNMVAIIDAIIDIKRVFRAACNIEISLKRSLYHLRVKPPHATRDFDALNELIIKSIIGEYKNKNITLIKHLYIDFFNFYPLVII